MAPKASTTGAAAPDPADPAPALVDHATSDGVPAPTLVVDAAAGAANVLAAAGAPIGGTILPEQPIPVPAGGPGAGALNVAERVETTELHPLDPEAAGERRVPRSGAFDPRYDARTGLPASGARVLGVFDASRIKGRRYATAARLIEHDNAEVRPGQFVPVTFQQFTDLVAIGAVVADDWDELEDVPGAGN